jgi:hypothetical protein
LIALFNQKYRAENPETITTKSNKRDNSSAHLRSSMENDKQYDYSYQQKPDYTQYGKYSTPPYVSNVNEQMLHQQPNVGYYIVPVWQSNVAIDGKPVPQFLQPMYWSYGQQQSPPPTIRTSVPNTINNKRIFKILFSSFLSI